MNRPSHAREQPSARRCRCHRRGSDTVYGIIGTHKCNVSRRSRGGCTFSTEQRSSWAIDSLFTHPCDRAANRPPIYNRRNKPNARGPPCSKEQNTMEQKNWRSQGTLPVWDKKKSFEAFSGEADGRRSLTFRSFVTLRGEGSTCSWRGPARRGSPNSRFRRQYKDNAKTAHENK